jgi:hypothetical protein
MELFCWSRDVTQGKFIAKTSPFLLSVAGQASIGGALHENSGRRMSEEINAVINAVIGG